MLEGSAVSVPLSDGAAKGRKTNKGNKGTVMMDTTNVLFILAGAFAGIEEIISNRLSPSFMGFSGRLYYDDDRERDTIYRDFL